MVKSNIWNYEILEEECSIHESKLIKAFREVNGKKEVKIICIACETEKGENLIVL